VVKDWGLFFPYSLLTVGMGVLSQEGLTPTELLWFLAANLLYAILFSALALHRLKQPEGLV
jgi:lantibiotic transport system permease protein